MDLHSINRRVKPYCFTILGVFLIALAYYFLFLPKNIVTGGVTGISIIFNGIFGNEIISSGLLILILNFIMLIIGLLFLGKEFLAKTILGSILLPFFITLFEILNLPKEFIFDIDTNLLNITKEIMSPFTQIIISVLLGSILTGVGLGLCFRVGATTGGMDVVQKIISKLFHFPYSKTVYITDGFIVAISLFIFGVEITFYSLISIYIIGIFLDLIYIGASSRRSVFILSKESEEIKTVIIKKLGRGVTLVPSIGGYSKETYQMLVCTLKKSESYLLRDLIFEIDPNAFTFFVSAKEVYGDGFQQ